nr:MAG TPA: hypothetical protein [Caudoviricetes sp.]
MWYNVLVNRSKFDYVITIVIYINVYKCDTKCIDI